MASSIAGSVAWMAVAGTAATVLGQQCPPAAPTGLSATQGTVCQEVDLNWTAVTGATSYTVYRNTTNNWSTSAWLGVVLAPLRSFHDDGGLGGGGGPQDGVRYYYWVTATRAVCIGNPTGPHSAVASGFSAGVPANPYDVRASEACGGLLVRWSTPAPLPGLNPTRFLIYRNTSSSMPTHASFSVSGSQRQYLDDEVVLGRTYFYWVEAWNDVCANAYSNRIGPASLSYAHAQAPVNDACQQATVVIAGQQVQGFNVCATGELGGICGEAPAAVPDVWYRFDAPSDGDLQVGPCGVTFTPVLAVFTSCPPTLATQLACSSNGPIAYCNLVGFRGVEAHVSAGASYFVRVAGSHGDMGSFTLRFQFTPSAPSCYANCDSSTTAPALNVLDFSCYLNKFASGDSYANCDGSTTAPVLNVLDFSCFLNAFATGCP